MAYINGKEVLFASEINITGDGGSSSVNDTWDLIITREMLVGTTLNEILKTASGRVFVKGTTSAEGDTIEVPSAVKLIEFAPSVVFNGNVDIIGSDDSDTWYRDDCQVIRGARNSGTSPSSTSGSETPKIKNFKGGVEHCHGAGWFFEDCNNIEHCTFLGINNCKNISHCNVGKGFDSFMEQIKITNSSDIEDLYANEETMSGWKFENCKFIRDIQIEATTGGTEFRNCTHISNISSNGSVGASFYSCKFIRDIHTPYGSQFYDSKYISTVCADYDYAYIVYQNCLYVDPYTCAGFLQPQYVGQNRRLTADGSFSAPYVD